MNAKSYSQSYDILHPSDQDRIISSYSNLGGNTNKSHLLTSVFFFVITTWAAIFLFFNEFYPYVTGSIKLVNLPYYMGLLGIWILYTTNYSFYFLKKVQNYTAGKLSSVGIGLIIQSFVYLVMAMGVFVKEQRSYSEGDIEPFKLSIPLIDNPSNFLILSGFLFGLGLIFVILSKASKDPSTKERADKIFFIIAAAALYAFTLAYNFVSYGWMPELILTSAMFSSIIMLGVTPYVYGASIYCGAKSSKVLNKNFYATVYGSVFLILLITAYRLAGDLFVLIHKHDHIDFLNYSLFFIAAILITAFTRFLTYPRLLDEYNADVMQTRRLNESNKGIMSEDAGLLDDDDEIDSISEEDLSLEDGFDEFNEEQPKQPSKRKKKEKPSFEEEYAIETDNEIDGLMADDD